jgi:hypothetical protein
MPNRLLSEDSFDVTSFLSPSPTFSQRTISHRERAEIQLHKILKKPEKSRHTANGDTRISVDREGISVREASIRLNTQPFIIRRLVKALYTMTTEIDEDTKMLDPGEIQRLTRVLNGPFDVRALLFFMILDEDSDHYVTKKELTHFFTKYLKTVSTFDTNRLQEVIPVLLQKFNFDRVRYSSDECF